MQTIQRLLDRKGHEIWSVSPDASVYRAIEIMADRGVGALLVLDEDEPVGMLSERDYARKVILQGRSSRETPVREIMTTEIVFAQADETVEECMARMTRRRIRHLPVLEDGRLVGMISIGDLVKSIISEQQFLIEQLEDYISG